MLTSNCLTKVQHVKQFLDQQFCIKDLDKLEFFLGLEISRSNEDNVFNQRKYNLEFIEHKIFLGLSHRSYPSIPPQNSPNMKALV